MKVGNYIVELCIEKNQKSTTQTSIVNIQELPQSERDEMQKRLSKLVDQCVLLYQLDKLLKKKMITSHQYNKLRERFHV